MKIRILKDIYISVSIILLTGICYSQNTYFKNVINAYEIDNYETLSEALKEIDTIEINDYDKATWFYYFSYYQLSRDQQDLAYKNILKSKKLFHKINKQDDVADCNILLLEILSHQNNLTLSTDKIIKELEYYAISQNDSTALRSLYHTIAVKYLDVDDAENSIKYFRKIIPIVLKQKDTVRVGHVYTNIGTVYYSALDNADSSLYYSKKAVPILKKHKDFQNLAYNYNNQAQQYKAINKYDEAIKYYSKADSIPLEKFEAKSKVIFYENISDAYLLNKDFENASLYLNKLNTLKDSINDTKQNIAISEIKEQYDNEKLRANNLEIEAKRKENQNIAIGLAGSLVLGSIITFLLFKNTKRKQKLAEREKELETQKLTTVLKEQELTSIDAMIEGQEKERQRIANDLHDDLGGLMATVKLHFNALKDKNTPELYKKTNILIDEAYQKIRTIAHAKNSGVIAKQGLLKAIQEMAEKVSASNKINIDVVDHGLENRIENSLELTIFRIIQELITNVMKHAEASEVTIHITNHDESLNIMVEDNGKGFNPNQITKTNKGMGISSIDKRVAHLDGTMTIESDKDQGTTIIIDIPI